VSTTVVAGDFEWDAEKAEANLAAHGVSFPQAVVAVVTIDRGERIRIISARRAEPAEVRRYRKG
jgi:uncharacterized DUF497 family protein